MYDNIFPFTLTFSAFSWKKKKVIFAEIFENVINFPEARHGSASGDLIFTRDFTGDGPEILGQGFAVSVGACQFHDLHQLHDFTFTLCRVFIV